MSGTIGFLLKGIATGILALAETDRLPAGMISHGYRAPVRSHRIGIACYHFDGILIENRTGGVPAAAQRETKPCQY